MYMYVESPMKTTLSEQRKKRRPDENEHVGEDRGRICRRCGWISTYFCADGVTGGQELGLGDVTSAAADGDVQRKDYGIAFSLVLCRTQALWRHQP